MCVNPLFITYSCMLKSRDQSEFNSRYLLPQLRLNRSSGNLYVVQNCFTLFDRN